MHLFQFIQIVHISSLIESSTGGVTEDNAAFADFTVVDAELTFEIPDSVTFDQAATLPVSLIGAQLGGVGIPNLKLILVVNLHRSPSSQLFQLFTRDYSFLNRPKKVDEVGKMKGNGKLRRCCFLSIDTYFECDPLGSLSTLAELRLDYTRFS